MIAVSPMMRRGRPSPIHLKCRARDLSRAIVAVNESANGRNTKCSDDDDPRRNRAQHGQSDLEGYSNYRLDAVKRCKPSMPADAMSSWRDCAAATSPEGRIQNSRQRFRAASQGFRARRVAATNFLAEAHRMPSSHSLARVYQGMQFIRKIPMRF